MATIQRRVLDAVVDRLRALPAIVPKPSDRIRIAHRSPITRENSPSVRVIPIEDDESGSGKGECVARRLRFAVQVIGRDDGGIESIDALLVDVLARLKPTRNDAIPYPSGVRLLPPGRVRFEDEMADADVALAEISFEATYNVAEWSLEA